MAVEAGGLPCVLENPKCCSKHQSSAELGWLYSNLQSIGRAICFDIVREVELAQNIIFQGSPVAMTRDKYLHRHHHHHP
jgi:hypothetical protein